MTSAESQKKAKQNIRRWREHPAQMVRELFGVQPDPWQEELLETYGKHPRSAGSACKGPGKTAGLAWIAWNFLLTRPHPKVPCTSITGDNLRDGLWAELAKWRHRSPLLQQAFEWTKTRIFAKDHPETWFASARSWARDADPTAMANTLAGLHEDYILFLIDEVSEMPQGVVAAAEATLSGGKEAHVVVMGNPTRTDGPLWNACKTERHLWNVVHITGDPDDPNRSPRIDINEARRMIEKYGRDSYIVRVNILGEFPLQQANKLIGPEQVAAAMSRHVSLDLYGHRAKVLGVDCARFGDDASIILPRQGRAVWRPREFRGLRTNELGDQVLRYVDEWSKKKDDAGRLIPVTKVFIDEGGLGAGVVDHCVARGYAKVVEGVNFGAKAIESERFENRRAEMYWKASEALKGAGEALPNLPMLAEELQAPTYWFDKKQRICLESKDDIKARLGRSPDYADAYVLTHAAPVADPEPEDFVPYAAQGAGSAHALTEYNPWS